jgi:hypothetical protein
MSMRDFSQKRGPRGILGFALALAFVFILPRTALPELRPLVRDMLENLSAINRIGEGVALEEYDLVRASARELVARARQMRARDLAALDLDPMRDPEWDAYLYGQEQAAAGILAAAEEEDARKVLQGVDQLVGNSCLPCHTSFRDPAQKLRASVLFMTSFLSAWRDMNRGLAINDFNLVGHRAREMQALTRVFSAPDVLESAFGVGGSKQQRIFRGFLTKVNERSSEIAIAAGEESPAKILQSSGEMWRDGCIACHERFRR